MSTYTEDHLVEQPAIRLMQDELGWEVGGKIEHRTPNIELELRATACGEAPEPLLAERRLQFAPCGIPISRVIGIYEDDN